jgi:hypothetical protein
VPKEHPYATQSRTRFVEALAAQGAVLLTPYVTSRTLHQVQCACGSIASLLPETVSAGRATAACDACRLKAKAQRVLTSQSPHSLENLCAQASQEGATLHSVEYTGNAQVLEFTCRCGTQTTVKARSILYESGKFRCRVCHIEAISGPNSIHWRPTAIRTRPPGIHRWYRQVMERDDFTCQLTGIRGSTLSAHHLYSFDLRPDLGLDLANGITIQHPLHKEFHNLFGHGKNTPEQFAEFKQRFVVDA